MFISRKLNEAFGLTWKRTASLTSIRYILKGIDPTEVKIAFRRHADRLPGIFARPGRFAFNLLKARHCGA